MALEVDPEEFYHRLITEAPYIPGDEGPAVPDVSAIPWLNPKLITEGQEFAQRNSFSVSLAHVGALLMGFSVKTLTTVLLRTGGYNAISSSMVRHVDTGKYINLWYDSNIIEARAKGFQGILNVRKLHSLALKKASQCPPVLLEDVQEGLQERKRILEALSADLAFIPVTPECPTHLLTYTPKVLMSQFDMALTQWGFVVFLYLHPATLGVSDTRGLEGFLHLWAVTGRLLGIQDRFNIALHPNRDLYLKLYHLIGCPCLKGIDLTILTLQEYYGGAVERLIPMTSFKGSLYIALNQKAFLPEFKGTQFRKLMSTKDKINVMFLQVILFLIFHSSFLRTLANWFQKYTEAKDEEMVVAIRKGSLIV